MPKQAIIPNKHEPKPKRPSPRGKTKSGCLEALVISRLRRTPPDAMSKIATGSRV